MRRVTQQPIRRWTAMLGLGLAMAAAPAAEAQVSAYAFSQSSGSYTPITGGTIVVANTEPYAGGDDSAAMDDFAYASVSLPFGFTFNGASYNSIRVVSNGWAYFSASSTAYNHSNPIGSTDPYSGSLSPLGTDLMGPNSTTGNTTTGSNTITNVGNTTNLVTGAPVYGAGIPTGTTVTAFTANTITLSANATSTNTAGFLSFTAGEIRVQSLGTSPNRTFVIQFKNVAQYATGTFSTNNTGFNFQIRLAEGGGLAANQTVTFVYGNSFMLSGSLSPQVGLRGSSNADYNNRTSTTSWSSTTSGTSNSATVTLSPTVLPASGLNFVWTPPTCFAPIAVTSTGVTTTAATISWTAPSTAPASGYQYEVRTSGAAGSGSTGLAASGATGAGVTTASISGLTAGTQYFVYIRSNCGGSFSNWTAAYVLTTQCVAITTLPWTDGLESVTTVGNNFPPCWLKQNGDWMTQNASYASGTNGPRTGSRYLVELWSATDEWIWTPTFQLTGGTSYDFTFYWVGDNYSGWTGDVGVNSSQSSTGATILGGSFVTSATTATNTYQQVIRSFTPSATGSYSFGIRVNATSAPFVLGFDDFSVALTPSCAQPTAVAVPAATITGTSAVVNWTAPTPPPANGYQFEVRTSGAPGSGLTGLAFAGNTGAGVTNAFVSSLTPATTYTVYVRANCGGTSFSNWTGGTVFNTTLDCGNATPIVCGASTTFTIAAGNGVYNNNACGYSTPGKELLYSFTPSVTGPYTLSVTAATGGYGDWMYKAAGTGCGPTGWTCIDDINGPVDNTVTLTANTQYYFLIDPENNTGISQTFTMKCCFAPSGLTATAATQTSVALGWTQVGTPAQWQIQYGSAGFTLGTGTTIGTTSNPYTLGGLSSGTQYSFFVRSICSPGDTSAWSSRFVFNTLCQSVFTLPYTETFAPYPTVCWTEAQGYLGAGSNTLTAGDYTWVEDGFLNNGTTGAAKINLYTTGRRDWIISPTINLGTAGYKVLEFDLGIVAYAGTTPTTLGSDDTVAVVISTDNGATWNSANVLRRWTAANTPLAGNGSQRVYIPLQGYGGLVKIGFYGSEGSTDDAPDNDIFIDSFRVSNCTPPVVALGNDTTLCPGSTLTLTSGTGTSYQWSTSANTQSITVSAAGTYSVITYNGNPGCFAGDTIVVSPGVLPVVNLGNDTTICSGSSLTLNAGNAGASYLWNPGATTAQTRTVNATGSYSVRVRNTQGCIGRDTINVTVAPLPVVNLGNDTAFCDGGSLVLNAGNAGAAYLWNPGATTGQTRTVTATGSYSVRVTSAQGCIGRDTINVTVNPIPFVNLGNDTTVCGNVASLVFDAGNAGATYTWTPSLGVTTQTYDVAPLVNYADLYAASLTASPLRIAAAVTRNGCTGSDTVLVTIQFTPRVSGINVSGGSPTFSFTPASDSFATEYVWNFGDNSGTMLTQNASHTYAANGTYTVTLVVRNNCGSDTVTRAVTVTGVGLANAALAPDMIALYPNPANQQFVIEDKSNLNLLEAQVYNAFGALVIQQPLSGKLARIGTASLAAGVYSVRVRTEKGLVIRRLEILR